MRPIKKSTNVVIARSEATWQSRKACLANLLDCFAPLAMTNKGVFQQPQTHEATKKPRAITNRPYICT
jgi:hypothetical protein